MILYGKSNFRTGNGLVNIAREFVMRKSTFVIACFGAICSFGALSAPAAEGVVSADLLNIRIQPDLKSAVAVKLDKGFKVEVLGESGDFFEIAAPVTVPVYVSAVYLNAGVTTAALKMYASASTVAASYGVLPRGTTVKLIGIDNYGWAKIEPPAGIKLYAAKRFVKVTGDLPKAPEAPAVKVEEKKEVRSAEVPAVKAGEKKEAKPAAKPAAGAEGKKEVKPAAKPAEKSEAKVEAPQPMAPATEAALKELGVDLSKGAALSVTGTLLKLETTTVPILGYVLMRNGTHEYYLCADKVAFDKLGGAPVTLRGRSFRVPNWRVPVFYVEFAGASK